MIHTTVPRATTIDRALQEVDAHTAVTGTEHVPLADCLGRVLAADLTAPMPVPAHPSSAMDGFAFRHADLATWRYILPLDGRVAAGHPLGHAVRPGHAVRIFTGGVLPPGADTVAIQEECVTTENVVVVPRDVPPGANVRPTGYDVPQGAVVLHRGTRLRPQDLGSAASVGRAGLDVHRRVRVAVLATGDELRPAGAPLPEGCAPLRGPGRVRPSPRAGQA